MVDASTRCLHPTKNGPCWRPAGHTANGHRAQSVLNKKPARSAPVIPTAESLGLEETPELLQAFKAIKAAAEARELALRLEVIKDELALHYGMKAVPMTPKELTAWQAANGISDAENSIEGDGASAALPQSATADLTENMETSK